MVRDLIEHHADPKTKNDDGKTPADIAGEKGHEAMVKLLS
jgi:ankyrin repeat protein